MLSPWGGTIFALAIVIVVAICGLIWAYETWPRRIVPDDTDDYGPVPNVETRAREASGEDAR
ncbi:MAG: hypothetical protein Q8M31_21925 [Beijerinckiaceae bacterium]|nr:hypothetical protein [Beijerinckiaceae bacterium]